MNMRHSLITATAVALGLAAGAPAIAQQTEHTTETTTTTTKTTQEGHHRYVYYGDHDIYFAPDTKTYYWQEDGEWRSGMELPVADRTYVTTGGVTIDLDTERPYERHEWVVKHYKHSTSMDHDDD